MRRLLVLTLCASLFFFYGRAQTDADAELETQPEAQPEAQPETRVTYRVDVGNGPDALAEEVAAAFAVWEGVEGADFTAAELGSDAGEGADDDATAVLGYGDAAQFGPDTVSLTLSSTAPGADAPRISVLLNPDADALRPAALLHETGVLAGVPASPTATGVMNPALSPDESAELTEADRAALVSLETFAPEDLSRDGVVDFYDLARFAAAFGQTGVNLEADFNNDGTVDEADLERLRAAYVFGPPSETAPATLAPAEGDATGGAATGGLGDFDESAFDENFGAGDETTEDDTTGGADVEDTDPEDTVTGGADTGGTDEDGGDTGGAGSDETGGATGGA